MHATQSHRDALHDLLVWRRDVRHFRPDPVPDDLLDRLRQAMDLAPSVGNARPWRVLSVQSARTRAAVIDNFTQANARASAIYDKKRRAAYQDLKLEGLRDAPVHLAVFTETTPPEGHGLGRQSMPEMLRYSTVAAIHTLWLAARAENVGVGWVSILDPDALTQTLAVPSTWVLTGYLCVGFPADQDDRPLLHRNGWQENTKTKWIRR